MSSKPISLAEVMRQKQQKVPDVVIDAINKLLAIKWDGKSAEIEQRALAEEMDCAGGVNEAYAMMDGIEELYATENWVVEFVQPDGTVPFFEPYYRFIIKPAPNPFGEGF